MTDAPATDTAPPRVDFGPDAGTMLLHRLTVRRAFVETDAEPKFTWLYSHPDAAAGTASYAADPDAAALADEAAPHVFHNVVLPCSAALTILSDTKLVA